MDEIKKAKHISISDLPEGLKDIAALPPEKKEEPKLILPPEGEKGEAIELPAATPNVAPARQERPKTAKEQELDALISRRQEIIEQLKAKNPLVMESRRKISEIIPSIRGKGSPQAIRLIEEAEALEFSIATSAYTPKKEKELIKHLRLIRAELSKHKELEAAQKAVDAERAKLHSIMSEIKSLEHSLFEARAACDAKYSEVLAERKAAYEQRQKGRDERSRKQDGERQRRFEAPRDRPRRERRDEMDSDMAKYMKDYDDTVSMEEIVQIERKEKKEKKEGD